MMGAGLPLFVLWLNFSVGAHAGGCWSCPVKTQAGFHAAVVLGYAQDWSREMQSDPTPAIWMEEMSFLALNEARL